MNIFEQLNILLLESESDFKKKNKNSNNSDIPIHPEMETKEQGEISAAEKVLKLFQKLTMGSGGQEEIKDGKPEIPDDIIDPKLKETPKQIKDKIFEKNKLTDWDEESEDKVEKEVDVENGDEDDEFDDFDWRNNQFGDEEDDDNDDDNDDEGMSVDDELKNNIDDAIDSLNNDEDEGDEGDEGGANWDDEDDEDGEDGPDGDGPGGEGQQEGPQIKPGGDDPQEGQQKPGGDGSDGPQKPGKDGSQDGPQKPGKDGQSQKTGSSGSGETMSDRRKRLEDLKKSLESDNMKDFNDKIKDIKESTEAPDKEIPGGQIETPSDDTFKKDMEKAGLDDKAIEEMTKTKNDKMEEDYNKEEMEKLKQQVVDGLENSCKKKGGSALASTIVKNSLKRKLVNEEWREMLKLFLKSKSINAGNMSTANKGIKWGNKNHLWRGAVLPTDGPSKGTIQTVHCIVDFSGSVNQDLVFTFLGKVIDLCVELKYTKVKVYGCGEKLTLPRTIDKKTLADGVDVALDQTWVFIESQSPGRGTTNFEDVAKEINEIKSKERNAVFLIFGDGLWNYIGPSGTGHLKYDIMNEKYLKDICMLLYYMGKDKSSIIGTINELEQLVGLEHIITTRAESIHK